MDMIPNRSRWIKSSPFTDTEECEHCGYNIVSSELETPFCPWCGYIMEDRDYTPEQKMLQSVWDKFTTFYEKAKISKFVRDPIAYSLYHTWKHFDRRK